ncbi:hypothetical protein J8V57_01440 [Xenorhabdus sp. PB61.4]|uniref:hypothetical protein n=1 Tax=Xenorhabdus sp. PB61.4 TaxID=2788940 RepID=UPI001E50EBE5|nr:hypothetical protein [Xenorhabdus sp. PB61.4]MCC8364954.1 hypothetical protein [Xenorhabdus sp. PB61.4]
MSNQFNEESSFAAYINQISPRDIVYTAELEITDFYKNGEGKAVAYGKVFNDSKNRFPDGSEIITSLVQNAGSYESDGYIKTQNSIYKIRKPSKDKES